MGYWQELRALLPIFVRPGRKNRAGILYDLLSDRYLLGERSLYWNLGYWENNETYDHACEKLACELARAADLRKGHHQLDVGFGFADQDMYWAEAFKPAKIIGLNINLSQVERARARVKERGLKDRIELLLGSATQMPLVADRFDRVTALETAFHYDTRETFFAEAFRVLKPGGKLATADVTSLEGERWSLRLYLLWYTARSFWQLPGENVYPPSVYKQKMEAAGFKNVTVRSIKERVFPPLLKFIRAKLQDREFCTRFDPLILACMKRTANRHSAWNHMDYVLADGTKPQ